MRGSKRRTKGEGSPQQLPSGLWRWAIVHKGKKVYGPARRTKTEAREALSQKLGEPAAGPSFTSFAREWRTHKTGSQTTLDQWTWLIEGKIANDPIGDLPVGAIREIHLLAWLKRQQGSNNTIRRNLGRVRQILKAAGNDVRTNPPPDPGHDRRPILQRDRAELAKLLSHCDEPTRRAVLLALQGGLSRSEICALRHEDAEDGGVWVQRRAILTKGEVRIEPQTKTKNRRRWLPLPDALDFVGKGKGFVLTDSSEPLSPDALTKRLKKALKGTRLDSRYFGLHALRRTYAMILLENGTDVRTAAELLGHDPMMTLRVYTRSERDLKVQAIAKSFGKQASPQASQEGVSNLDSLP